MENESSPRYTYFAWRNGHLFIQHTKKHLVTFLFDIIGFTISIGLVLMGYTYGKSASNRVAVTTTSKAFQETSSFRPPFPDREQQKKSSDCPEGFQRISFQELQLCLPGTFSLESNSADSQRFRSSDEEFVINFGIPEQFPIELCHLEKEIVVAGRPATRTIFRQETGAGCGDIIGFATNTHDASGADVQLHLWKETSTYDQEQIYEAIERSVQF